MRSKLEIIDKIAFKVYYRILYEKERVVYYKKIIYAWIITNIN
ncbi:MAG: hypothetical protein OWQ50_07525 [Acidianus infernus]|nr:hypothetical protein [Acidianus infernus]